MSRLRLTRDGTADPSRETKFSGASTDRQLFISPVQLTTSRIGNLTRLIHTLAISETIHTYIPEEGKKSVVFYGLGIDTMHIGFKYS